jgi:hypothetical protein
MFWIGLLIGLVLGANVGIVLAAMLCNARRKDAAATHLPDQGFVVISNNNRFKPFKRKMHL